VVWRLNSPNNPDISVVGHQPKGWDQITFLYGKYCVLSTRLDIEILTEGSSPPLIVVLSASSINGSGATVQSICEDRYSQRVVVGAQTGMGRGLITQKVSMKRMLGQKNLDSDPTYYGIVGSDPTEIVFGYIKMTSGTATFVDCLVNITISFKVKFKEFSDPSQS
jgi:hypothetical protein